MCLQREKSEVCFDIKLLVVMQLGATVAVQFVSRVKLIFELRRVVLRR